MILPYASHKVLIGSKCLAPQEAHLYNLYRLSQLRSEAARNSSRSPFGNLPQKMFWRILVSEVRSHLPVSLSRLIQLESFVQRRLAVLASSTDQVGRSLLATSHHTLFFSFFLELSRPAAYGTRYVPTAPSYIRHKPDNVQQPPAQP